MKILNLLPLLVSAASAPALAAYPEKPVRLIVTFAAGGASDIVARVISEPLGHVAMLGIAPVLIMANPKSGPATLKDMGKSANFANFAKFGSGGPARLPKEVSDKLAKALADIVADPAIIKRHVTN